MLLQKAACMFPEGNGAPKAFTKDGAATEKLADAHDGIRRALPHNTQQRTTRICSW